MGLMVTQTKIEKTGARFTHGRWPAIGAGNSPRNSDSATVCPATQRRRRRRRRLITDGNAGRRGADEERCSRRGAVLMALLVPSGPDGAAPRPPGGGRAVTGVTGRRLHSAGATCSCQVRSAPHDDSPSSRLLTAAVPGEVQLTAAVPAPGELRATVADGYQS